MSFAKAVLSGVLAAEPEKRFTPNDHAVANFVMLVENPVLGNRPGAGEPFAVKVTCWRSLADAVATQLHKGDNVLVEGKLMMGSFQGEDGVQKKQFELEAITIERLTGKPEAIVGESGSLSGSGSGGSGSGYATAPMGGRPNASYDAPQQSMPAPAGHFSSEDLLTEDDIPF